MPAAVEVPVTLLCLRERESSVDHRVQAMQGERAVHRFEIGATADACATGMSLHLTQLDLLKWARNRTQAQDSGPLGRLATVIARRAREAARSTSPCSSSAASAAAVIGLLDRRRI
jgi:hypothetical protein